MKKRQKRLLTSVSALLVALLAFAGAPDRALGTSYVNSCSNMYACVDDCDSGPCNDEECGSCCIPAYCSNGKDLVVCTDF